MIFWFYFLWSIAVVQVFLFPFRRLLRTALWSSVVIAGAWLILGAITYQTQYTAYSLERARFEAQKESLSSEKMKLESLYRAHPTAIDILTKLAYLSYQFGEHEKVLRFLQEIEQVDPNSPETKELRLTLQ